MELRVILAQIERILGQGIRAPQSREYLFGKDGLFRQGFRALKYMPAVDRRTQGQALHQLQKRAENLVKIPLPTAVQAKQATIPYDPTLPGLAAGIGHRHPISLVTTIIVNYLQQQNYQVELGTEIERGVYNFDKLNIPPEHPARESHDTIWINLKKDLLLRTQTSPVQIRVMEGRKPPLKIVVPGRVFRYEAEDATHVSVFHQIEGFVVQEGVTMGHLKWTLEGLGRAIFGPQTSTRFRPSYFPFTEPSAEVDITCRRCRGKGCGLCKQTGWIEMLGAGMIHPLVLREVGYNPRRVSGFAFGIGVERVAMVRFGIEDIRVFLNSHLALVEQFPGVG